MRCSGSAIRRDWVRPIGFAGLAAGGARRAPLLGLLVAVMVLIGGCDMPMGDPRALPRQAVAIQLIWQRAYQQTKAAPVVYWRRDDCDAPNGIYGMLPYCTFFVDGVRMAGVETTTDQWVEVGAPSDGFAISDTALAHELLHAAIGDADHSSPEWDCVWQVDAALKAIGL